MITWMQRHKKWLIITIWISTIAFVGAGFVGWGQYSYGDKAGAVAKVGNVEISMGELQKNYSNLYAQYSSMFGGNFDEEKAKQFGLQKQALDQLIQQALIVNLAQSYELSVTDEEVVKVLQSQEFFFKDGIFDKETYKNLLSQNRLTTKEYETELKKNLLIMKTLSLLPIEATQNEKNILQTLSNIADKINYKVLSQDEISIETTDELIKPFWEQKRHEFMSEVSYDVKYITQAPSLDNFDDAALADYYEQNKMHFKDSEGKIVPLENAKADVIKELKNKQTKEEALRTYIAYKKGELPKDLTPQTATISASKNPFTPALLEKVAQLTSNAPYLKPILINDVYYIFELVNINPSKIKTYEEAKAEVLPLYTTQEKQKKLLELANSSLEGFKGTVSDFFTFNENSKLTLLTQTEAREFLNKLFVSNKKRSFIQLSNSKVVLYEILEQKLLTNANNSDGNEIARLKGAMFNEGLIKTLENKYQSEIFIQGL
jgi:peptidyl-prolyl cis-trans isomerase D